MARVDKTDGMSAEGSGRVSLMADSGLVHSYTLECNYNTGKALNHVPAAHGGHQGRASPERTVTSPPKYGPEHWMEVGRAVLVALLDMKELNPWSRVGNSTYRTVARARVRLRRDPPARALPEASLDRRFSERQERHAAEAKAKKCSEPRTSAPTRRPGSGAPSTRGPSRATSAATSGARGGGGAGTWSKGASRFGNPSQHANNANPITASSSSSSGCGGGGGNESDGRGSAVAMKQAARARRIAAASAAVSAATSMARSSSGGSSSTSGRKGGWR